MTPEFRKARDEGLRSLYVTLIRAGKYRLDAIRIVHEEAAVKWGLSEETVRFICCGYGHYQPPNVRKKKRRKLKTSLDNRGTG